MKRILNRFLTMLILIIMAINIILPNNTVYAMGVPNQYTHGKVDYNILEGMLADLTYSLANGLHTLSCYALGEIITIDDLVFNNYGETKVSYFDKQSSTNSSSLIYGSGSVGGLDKVIKTWYNIFLRIAIIGYLSILVYMGIRIMLASTAEKKAEYKKLFFDWVVGISILFIFPYAMKYMIKINDAFVETIEDNNIDSGTQRASMKSLTVSDIEILASSVDEDDADEVDEQNDIDNAIDWESGTDYMSKIADAAKKSHRFALSFAFMIMTWQLIALVFYYFKRLFTIGFLIVIFPLVALSYAVDKIADGKTQAFNTWAKEYMLNVFVQTFHAIVYVFVCSTVYSASGITNGGAGFDFILIIVGVKFLFSGEEIIRKIFGQVSQAGSINMLSESAAATFAKFKIAEGAIKKVQEFTYGDKSLIGLAGKIRRGVNDIKAADYKYDAFKKFATKPQEYSTERRLEHFPDTPPHNASPEVKKDFMKEASYFNSASVLNNPNSHSEMEKAKALKNLEELAVLDYNHDVFKDSKFLTAGQFAEMAALNIAVEKMIYSGMERVDIERKVTAKLGVILAANSEEERKAISDTFFSSLYLNGSHGTITEESIERELNSNIKHIKTIDDSINMNTSGILPRRDYQRNNDEVTDFVQDMEYEYSGNVGSFAQNIAILNQRNYGARTEKDLLEAAKYVKEHINDSEENKEIAQNYFGEDIDVFTHILSRKILRTTKDEKVKVEAQKVIDEYEKNPREGYYKDEVSPHEIIKKIEYNENKKKTSDFVNHMKTDYSDDVEKFAESIAILKQKEDYTRSKAEIEEAEEYVKEHIDDSEDNKKIFEEYITNDNSIIIERVYYDKKEDDTKEQQSHQENKEDEKDTTKMEVTKFVDDMKYKYSDDVQEFAESVAVINQRFNKNRTRVEIERAEDYIREHIDDNEDNREIFEEYYKEDDELEKELIERGKIRNIDYKNALAEDDLEQMIDSLLKNRREAMDGSVAEIGKEYLIDNDIDPIENYYDTDIEELEGLREEELLVKKINARARAINNLLNIGKPYDSEAPATFGFFDRISKEYILDKEEEKTKILSKAEERKKAKSLFSSSEDFIKERKEEREKIKNKHRMGDIIKDEEDKKKSK